jgi:hypothetical protein
MRSLTGHLTRCPTGRLMLSPTGHLAPDSCLRRQPRRSRSPDPHSRQGSLDHIRPTTVPDRRLRRRHVTSVDRTGNSGRGSRHRVRYTTVAASVNELVEPPTTSPCPRPPPASRVDLCCLDELGYLELDRRGSELVFQVFTEREEKTSTAIASNAAFSEWAGTFTGPACAPPSSTGSPSKPTSSRPAPTPTADQSTRAICR